MMVKAISEGLITAFKGFVEHADRSMFYSATTRTLVSDTKPPVGDWEKLPTSEVVAIAQEFLPIFRANPFLKQFGEVSPEEDIGNPEAFISKVFTRLSEVTDEKDVATQKMLISLIKGALPPAIQPPAPGNCFDPYFESTSYDQFQRQYY